MSQTANLRGERMGIIFDIKRYSLHDGPGIRTTVFLKGCPLNCPWCQNPESRDYSAQVLFREAECIVCGTCTDECPTGAISSVNANRKPDTDKCIRCGTCTESCPTGAREMVGRVVSVQEVVRQVAKDQLFYDESGGGVTFSGGEPLAQPDFLAGLLEACGAHGFHRAVDTTGFASPDTLLRVARETDLFLYDLKLMDPELHLRFTGVSNQIILSNLELLARLGIKVNVRYPVIPNVNDDLENVRQTANFIRSLDGTPEVSLLPFHRAAKDKHKRFDLDYRLDETLESSEEQLDRICEIMEENGLTVKIGG